MKNTFPGFPPEGIAFLRNLKKHNDREWFTPRKAVFEETVKKPMIELVGAIHREMLRFAPDGSRNCCPRTSLPIAGLAPDG